MGTTLDLRIQRKLHGHQVLTDGTGHGFLENIKIFKGFLF